MYPPQINCHDYHPAVPFENPGGEKQGFHTPPLHYRDFFLEIFDDPSPTEIWGLPPGFSNEQPLLNNPLELRYTVLVGEWLLLVMHG